MTAKAASRMTSIDAWMRRQAAREGRVVTLEDALLGERPWSYALYRLRYFAARCLSSALIHGIRLTFLRYVFSHRVFLATLVLTAVVSAASSFWWGALEALRARVRHLWRDAERQRIPGEIGQWLSIAAGLALVVLLAPLAWIGWEVGHLGHGFNVLHLYVLAVCLRLSADLLTLTLHSGVYAVRRVYRPLPAMFAVELAGALAALALWPWLGRWSFPLAVLVSSAIATALVVHYAGRLYRLLGWLPLRLAVPDGALLTRWRTLREFFAAGASYAVMRLDGLLMLAVAHGRDRTRDTVTLFVLFVAIAPAVRAGFDWAQLLYFDLKKLDVPCLQGLRRRYERLTFYLASLVGLALWGLACIMATLILQRDLGHLYWLLAPFFLARSFLGVALIQAFAKRRYGALLLSGTLLLAFLLVVPEAFAADAYVLPGLAAVCGLVAAGVAAGTRRLGGDPLELRVLPLAEWLQRVGQVREPVRAGALRFRSDISPRLRSGSFAAWVERDHWRLRRLARRLARTLHGNGAVAVLYPSQIVWYETAKARPVRAQTLLRWGGGLVQAAATTRFEAEGRAALQAAWRMNLFGRPLRRPRRLRDYGALPEEAQAAFVRLVPQGVVYALDGPVPALLHGLSTRQRRRIFFEAVHFARHLQDSRRDRRFEVSSFCVDGELRLIFIVDRRTSRAQRARWNATIAALNVESALAPERVPDVRQSAVGT